MTNMSPTTLTVIDMQPYFKETARKCLSEVKREIERAKQRKAAIVFVEYRGLGPTYRELTDLVKN